MGIQKKYKIGFDLWSLILFLIIMIPNFIWFVVPAPNDILRVDSVTNSLDMIASVCQVIMIITLCFIINKTSKKAVNRSFRLAIVIFCFIYFVGWIFYYHSITNPLIILDLCIAPCLAFLLYAIARKNIIAVVPTVAFMICHLIYGVVNFVLY